MIKQKMEKNKIPINYVALQRVSKGMFNKKTKKNNDQTRHFRSSFFFFFLLNILLFYSTSSYTFYHFHFKISQRISGYSMEN